MDGEHKPRDVWKLSHILTEGRPAPWHAQRITHDEQAHAASLCLGKRSICSCSQSHVSKREAGLCIPLAADRTLEQLQDGDILIVHHRPLHCRQNEVHTPRMALTRGTPHMQVALQ